MLKTCLLNRIVQIIVMKTSILQLTFVFPVLEVVNWIMDLNTQPRAYRDSWLCLKSSSKVAKVLLNKCIQYL